MKTRTSSNRNAKCCCHWPSAAAVAVVLAVTAGCVNDAQVAPEEPSLGDAQSVTVPASADTSGRLGITNWHYMPASEGIVVRGLAPDAVVRARFGISAGDASDELVVRETDTGQQVSILRGGGVRGDDARLRDIASAFRADVEATLVPDKGDRSQHVVDRVQFCPGDANTFSTWFFGDTVVQIENPSQSQWMLFSFQAGLFYQENWIPPGGWSIYPRSYVAVPLRLNYKNSWPAENPGPCPVHVNVL
jgi:hypothetical protein